MKGEKQEQGKESLNWINSKIGAKDPNDFKNDSLDYLRHSAIYCILSLHNFQSIRELDQSDVYHILKAVSRNLQSAFGLDNVYYLDDGNYLVVYRYLDQHQFTNKLREVIKKINKVTSAAGNNNGNVHADFMNACPVDGEDVDKVIRLTKLLAFKKNRINKDNYLNYYALSSSKIEYYYHTDLVDPVTGLLDEQSFLTMAQSVIDYANKENNESADHKVIAYFNLLNFKLFNDKYGYEKGNLLLEEFGNILREKYPKCLISRFEADHFYVMTDQFDYDNYFNEIQRLTQKYNRGILINVRGGICSIPRAPEHTMISYCDHAKIASDFIKKRNDLYRIYNDTFKGECVRQKYIIENFRQALENDWIRLYYQPVVRSLNGKLTSMEVLARWQDPNYGLLPPYVFISTLEEYHLIHFLDSYVIRNVCKTYRERKDNNLPVFPVSFNLSRIDFELCDIFQVIEDCAKEYRVPKSFLNVEITESVIIDDTDFIKKQIKRFHDAGYQIWMDDFGSEFSSLNVLKEFDFDELKIDMRFLSEFNQNSKQIITSVVNMAKEIGIQTLAEGVETEEQYQFLKRIG
jgi:diguanylate cyclase (GGDEF)-like protein